MGDPVCRVIIDPPASGDWNMAVDAAMLEAAVTEKLCALRWYLWSEPTLSLGYFQKLPEQLGEASGLPVVRRLTGGGAIVHHHELTYSCVVPAGHSLAREPQKLYEAVHEQIARVSRAIGATVAFRGRTIADRSAEFLCFARGDSFDLVAGETKVLGSAQRRRRGAILQHGSLILKTSPFAPHFPGLHDLCPAVEDFSVAAWLEELGPGVGALLGSPVEMTPLPDSLRVRAAELLRFPS